MNPNSPHGVLGMDARQQFEAWMRRAHQQHSLERTDYPGDHGEGDYLDPRTHGKWQTWQAARTCGVTPCHTEQRKGAK
jgi:hypothetical protein